MIRKTSINLFEEEKYLTHARKDRFIFPKKYLAKRNSLLNEYSLKKDSDSINEENMD